MSRSPRIFLRSYPSTGDNVELSQELEHHLFTVLRLKPGDACIVVSRDNLHEFEARVTEDGISIEQALLRRSTFGRTRVLYFALTKGERNDLVCEKASELGASHIVFWQAERSVKKLQTHTASSARWERIAESAARQSDKNFVPSVHTCENVEAVTKLAHSLAEPGDGFFCCSLDPRARLIRELSACNGRAHLVVGPEGDLTLAEEECLIQHGFQLVSLGPAVLRAETAAIVGLSVIEGLWGSPSHDQSKY